jgi:ubiquinone/menaquinone biosynthesis C-methylase UbiE
MSVLSQFYDFYDGPEAREEQFNFYASLFDPGMGELLDLTCGTGIITIELARRGFRITGLDYDDDMLAIANRKLAAETGEVRQRVSLQLADMKDFTMNKLFCAAIIPSNSFGYLFKLDDQRTCLKRIYEHLIPEGILVIEERYLSLEVLTRMVNLRFVERTWESRINPQTGKYTMFKDCVLGIDPVSQTIFSSVFVEEVQEDGIIKRYVPTSTYFGHRKHYFNPIEIRLLVESCGFLVKEIWGDRSKQKLTQQSNNIIVVAKKV